MVLKLNLWHRIYKTEMVTPNAWEVLYKKNPRDGRKFSDGIMARGVQSNRIPYK